MPPETANDETIVESEDVRLINTYNVVIDKEVFDIFLIVSGLHCLYCALQLCIESHRIYST